MALNQEFFDAINIDVVKKKYYNANKVNTLLEDIRIQAVAMTAENEQLQEQLRQLTEKKAEIGETLVSAQTLAKRIVEQANARADEIVAAAEAKRDELLGDGTKTQEYAARSVEKVIEELKNEHLRCIELLNAKWQSFLCGLDTPTISTEAESTEASAAPVLESCESASAETDICASPDTDLPELSSIPEFYDDEDDEIPLDSAPLDAKELEARVAAIAKELNEIIG